jgi:hypothetical protein
MDARPAADQVQFGGRRPPIRSAGRRRTAVAVGIAALLALASYGLAARHHGKPQPAPVSFINTGHRLLGVTGSWKLYAQGADAVVRIQLARGQVTVTRFPQLRSSGPVSFVVGRDWALVRPLDHVPGYLISASEPARVLSGPLGPGGMLLLPGPGPGQLWSGAAVADAGPMLVRRLDGTPTGTTGPRLEGSWPVPSGTGSYLLLEPNGISIPQPGGTGLTTLRLSSVLAIGPGSLLVTQCRRFQCAAVLFDERTGQRRALPSLNYDAVQLTGVIAPDGRLAAFSQWTHDQVALELLNLTTGTERKVLAPLGQAGLDEQSLVWSPDSRWLFAALNSGRIVAINAASGRVTGLGIRLPPVSQLAIWPGSTGSGGVTPQPSDPQPR